MSKIFNSAAIAAACVVGALAATSTASAQTTMRLGHCCAPNHNIGITADKFAELVSSYTDGAISIAVSPQGQLGGEREMLESVRAGIVPFTVVSTGPTPGLVPVTGVLNLPYLFSDYDHADRVLDGEIGQEILEAFTGFGIKALAFSEVGFRHLTTRRPVKDPADLQGLSIRTMENNIHMEAFRTLGAAAVPMSFGELYIALEQGVIDGQENPLTSVLTARFYEVQEYLGLTAHFYQPTFILMNGAAFNRLSDEHKDAVMRAAVEAGQYTREFARADEADTLEKIRETGMTVIEIDHEAFRQASMETYARVNIGGRGNDIIAAIQAMR